MEHFTASDHWIHEFKRQYRVTSRKITKLVTHHDIQTNSEIKNAAQDFVTHVRQTMVDYDPADVFNTDQMGIELEVYSKRTLSFKGEDVTLGRVKSKNATSHSYTVQPTISAAGHLTSPVYLCLKERNGQISQGNKNFELRLNSL